jgi:hypothetical protein
MAKPTKKPRRKGRPGPKPTGNAKYGFLGMRVPDALREQLQAAAHISGRSMSGEAQVRLETSFTKEAAAGHFSALHYGAAVAAIAELLTRAGHASGAALSSLRWHQQPKQKGAMLVSSSWVDDIAAYEAAVAAINRVLDRFRPEPSDPASPPPPPLPPQVETALATAADDLVDTVIGENDALYGEATRKDIERWAAPLREKLGPQRLARAKRSREPRTEKDTTDDDDIHT